MKKYLTYNKHNVYVFFISIFLLIILNPYYIWGRFQEFYTAVLLVLLILSFFFRNTFSVKKALFSVFIFFLVFVYYEINGASVLGGFAFALGVAFIFSIDNNYLLKIFNNFKFLYALVLFPGMVLWVTHFFIGNDFLYLGEIPDEINPNPLKVEAGQGYALYPFTVVLDYMLSLPIYRFIGPFDEPGRVGTVSAVILAINNFKFKQRSDYLVFFSGLVSLSLAFYVLIFIYLLVASFSNIKHFAIFCLFVLSVFFAASFNENISRYTVDRVSITNGKLSGDNRSNDNLDYYFDGWANGGTAEILLGVPEYVPDGASSWKEVVVKTGIIGVTILLAVFFCGYLSVGILYYNCIPLAAFLLVFLASFYQRPDVLNPIYMMFFLLGLISSKKNSC